MTSTLHSFLPLNGNIFPFLKEPDENVTCVSPMNLLMFSDRKIMSPSWVTTAMKPSNAFRYKLSICWLASASDSFSEQTGKRGGSDSLHECGTKAEVTGSDEHLPEMPHGHYVDFSGNAHCQPPKSLPHAQAAGIWLALLHRRHPDGALQVVRLSWQHTSGTRDNGDSRCHGCDSSHGSTRNHNLHC